MTRGLDGRVALVTGANHGIGAAIARTLALDGCAVLVTYLRLDAADDPALPVGYGLARQAGADGVVDAIRSAGGRADSVEADLTDDTMLPGVLDRAEAAFGPVEILVLNASSWLADTFVPSSTDRFDRRLQPVSAASHDRQFAVDARAHPLLLAEFARRHIARRGTWGRVVALSSGGPSGFPQEVSYGAAKAALDNYVMSAAFELARHGVTANVVLPGACDTGWITDAVAREVAGSSPFGTVTTPDEVAGVVALLCTDRAGRLTAQRLEMR